METFNTVAIIVMFVALIWVSIWARRIEKKMGDKND
jgi:hypothetical protein